MAAVKTSGRNRAHVQWPLKDFLRDLGAEMVTTRKWWEEVTRRA